VENPCNCGQWLEKVLQYTQIYLHTGSNSVSVEGYAANQAKRNLANAEHSKEE
jgi:hypothetical protein